VFTFHLPKPISPTESKESTLDGSHRSPARLRLIAATHVCLAVTAAGHYSPAIQSYWADAKEPTAQRTVLHVATDTTGLTALRDLIDRVVTP
jgi:hypothetical protein